MEILLTTLNARYSHTSIALRYLYANLNELKEITQIKEFTINDNIHEIAEKILRSTPSIIGIGVYIWNSLEVYKLITIIKQISPKTIIILGGPEVSYTPHRVDFTAADYIIEGEGEVSLYNLLKDILSGISHEKTTIKGISPSLESLQLPYKYYTDSDIKNRVIYVEASRGCPFTCEFCLSSIDKIVRNFNIELLLVEFQNLWDRGARNFKFIDRTFNLNVNKTILILDFFLNKVEDYSLHFEVIPEYFPTELRTKIASFKPGTIQLEVGIQTLNPEIANRINRNMNFKKISENLQFLQNSTNSHLHVDLIIGLPGETIKSFADNLNKLGSLTNCEIQLGVLKKLSGTTIDRHDTKFGMTYQKQPPYEILENDLIPFFEMQELKRFARYWDIVYNSGNFKLTVNLIWPDGDIFTGFSEFTKWLYKTSETTYQISLNRISEYIFTFLTEIKNYDKIVVADSIVLDISKISGRKLPSFLREHASFIPKTKIKSATNIGKRQKRHID
ncbi:MAG: B12-binding domain-containing radical SAM protein [Spirochaetaceae bacterium]